MLVTAGSIILFYTSPDLKNWEPAGGFGPGYGATAGVWETPDLFELPVEGSAATRWVLAVAVQSGAPAGGSGVQYFVGGFDGSKFTSENPKDTTLWADYGADFYAAQSWNDAPAGRHIWAAWLNNWQYANVIPTGTWRGALTLPRELSLVETADGIRLRQRPLPELERLRGRHWRWQEEIIAPGANLLAEIDGATLEIIAEFEVSKTLEADRVGLRLRTETGEQTTVGYTLKSEFLFVDRAESGQTDFSPTFPGVHTAPMQPVEGRVRLHILVDRSSVEVFGNDGLVVMTEQIFPAGDSVGLELFADGGSVRLVALELIELRPATFSTEEGNSAIEHFQHLSNPREPRDR